MYKSKKINKIYSFFLLISISFFCSSQNNRVIDSLREVVKTTKDNQTKIKALTDMVYSLTSFGKFDTANILVIQAQHLAKKYGDKKLLANTYNAQGINFQVQGNFPEAIDTYFEAVKINEILKDELNLAFNYGNISNVYFYQKNYDESLHYLQICLDIFKKNEKHKRYLALTYANMGKIYLKLNQNELALKSIFTAIDLEKANGESSQLAYFYGLIGTAYYQKKVFVNSIKYLTMAIKIKERNNDKVGLVESYIGIGTTFLSMDNYKLSDEYSKKAIGLLSQMNSMELKKESYFLLSNIEQKKGNFDKSLNYYKIFVELRDSIYSIEKSQKTIQTKLQFDYDKKSALKQVEQEKKDVIALEKNKRNNAILISISLLLLLFSVFIYFLYKSNLNKKKTNLQLELKNNYINEQKIEVENQKIKIENQQKEVLASIKYASKIQKALLPNEKYIQKKLNKK